MLLKDSSFVSIYAEALLILENLVYVTFYEIGAPYGFLSAASFDCLGIHH